MAEPAKRCRDCGEVKPLDEFPRQSGRPDGRHTYCLLCNRSRSKASKDRRRAGKLEDYSMRASRAALKTLAERHPEEFGALVDEHLRELRRQVGLDA